MTAAESKFYWKEAFKEEISNSKLLCGIFFLVPIVKRCHARSMKGKGWHPEKNPSWKEPLQKSQFLTENSFTMSHFRPTSRGENLGEHLDVFRLLQVSQVKQQMVGTCGKRFMWLKMKGGATYLAETANRGVQPTRIADFKFCIIRGKFMT